MKRVTGIGGVFFKSKDPKALTAWYQRHLGVDVLAWGGTVFRAEEGDATAWSVKAVDSKEFEGSFQINYRVENLKELLQVLKEENVHVFEEVQETDEYGSFGWILDLDGNKVELWQPPLGNAKKAKIDAGKK